MDAEQFMTEIIPIKDKKLRAILKKECRVEQYNREDTINEVGKVDRYIRFLISGVVRGYITDPKGKETTMSFLTRQGDIIAGSRMLDGSASEIGFKALKDSTVFCVPVDLILKLRLEYPELVDLQLYMLAQSSLYHWETRKMLYINTAAARYEWFLQHYPGMIDTVQHTYIASFLNITPVTLSRIRHHAG